MPPVRLSHSGASPIFIGISKSGRACRLARWLSFATCKRLAARRSCESSRTCSETCNGRCPATGRPAGVDVRDTLHRGGCAGCAVFAPSRSSRRAIKLRLVGSTHRPGRRGNSSTCTTRMPWSAAACQRFKRRSRGFGRLPRRCLAAWWLRCSCEILGASLSPGGTTRAPGAAATAALPNSCASTQTPNLTWPSAAQRGSTATS